MPEIGICDPNEGVPDGRIVGGIYRYAGTSHPWARGLSVRVVAVHRDGWVFTTDAEVGELLPDDVVEFTPWVQEQGRFSWISSDARAWELVPIPREGGPGTARNQETR